MQSGIVASRRFQKRESRRSVHTLPLANLNRKAVFVSWVYWCMDARERRSQSHILHMPLGWVSMLAVSLFRSRGFELAAHTVVDRLRAHGLGVRVSCQCR